MRVEIRSKDRMDVSGYVNVTGRDSRPLRDKHGLYTEQIAPGTFAQALTAGTPVELRFNHKAILGSTENCLELREDNVGLKAECVVTDPNVIAKAEAGELRGWSFGFVCRDDDWTGEGDARHRTVKELELREVSILDKTPAYIATSIETRGEDELLVEYRFDAINAPDVVRTVETETKETITEQTEYGESQTEVLRKMVEVYKAKRREPA